MLRLTLRNLFARKVRLVMSGLAIVIGVAFLSGVLVFSNGLSTTFDGIINGSTPDGVVRVQNGEEVNDGYGGQSDQSLDPAVVDRIAALPEVDRADGDVVGLGMNVLASDGTVIGGTGAPTLAFNHHTGPNMAGEEILELVDGSWPTADDEIAMDETSVEKGGYSLGDEVGLVAPFGEVQRTATLVGVAGFNGGGTAGATLLVFSTHAAQELFLGGADAFNQISLTAADGVTQQELVAAVGAVVPDGFEAVTGDQVAEESQDAVGSFLDVISTFLLVFAIIAVIVGGFIIVNTFSILIAQRTRELALLRALGASSGQVSRSVLVEALVLSVVASTLAIGLGLLLARGLAAVFRGVGLDIGGDALDLTRGAVVTSYVVGIGVTLAAAWFPGRRAGRVPPVAAMRADSAPTPRGLGRRTVIAAVILGVGAVLAGVGLAGAPGSDAAWIGVGAVLWILTVAAISPVIGKPVLASCRSVFGRLFGTTGRLAGENALRDPRRTGATASALMIGLALVSTIAVLAASLNKSVDDVVDEQFTADLLIQNSTFTPFSTTIGDRIATIDGVGTMSRQQFVQARHGDESASVTGLDQGFNDIYDLTVLDGTDALGRDGAIVTKDYADANALGVGDPLDLTFGGGKTLDSTVVGIVDGAETITEVNIPLAQFVKLGVVRQDSAISILFAPGADTDSVRDQIEAAAAPAPTVAVNDKEQFADGIRDQVDQLLAIIYGLLALAIVIAVIGIINTLGLSVIERTREIGLLRAVGMSRARLRRMITLESVAIAVLGAVLGMLLGVVIGVLLQQTLKEDLTSLGLPLTELAGFLVVSIAVGVLAAVIPAIRAARLDVLDAISTE